MLNQDQENAVSMLHKFINNQLDNKEPVFLLSGGAGTGKTFTIGAFLKEAQKKHRLYIACSAPTNKAVKVLSSSTKHWGVHNIDYGTIFQFLGLKIDYDDYGGKRLTEGKMSTIREYDLVIIDEVSMINSELWDLLLEVAIETDIKFIFMGDDAQLNPVHEEISPVFQIVNQFKLTQVMRTACNNPVMSLIEASRAKVYDPATPLPFSTSVNEDKSNGVWILPQDKWLKHLVAAFQSPKYQDNPDYARAIAWTNKKVDWINNYIRSQLYNNNQQQYLIGERIIAKEPLFDKFTGQDIIAQNSEELTIKTANLIVNIDGYKVWDITAMCHSNGETIGIQALDQSAIPDFKAQLAALADVIRSGNKRIKWADYWAFYNRYANINYAYALTSHKSQGSTFNNVFVAKSDIMRNPKDKERYRSLYVTLSRTSERLFISP